MEHPRYGLVLKALPHVSVYGVFSESAEPERTALRFGSLAFDDPRQRILTINQNTDL